MSSEAASTTGSKRQRIMIIVEDDRIVGQYDNNNGLNLLRQIVLQSDGQDQMPILQKRNKRRDSSLICVVCGSSAHGFNFGAITCESCKAFFRRNARKDLHSLSCKNNGTCYITLETRRSCVACRLAKCFNNGMQCDRVSPDKQNPPTQNKTEENHSLTWLSDSQTNEQAFQLPSPTFFDDLFTSLGTNILPTNDVDPLLSHSQRTSLTSEDLQRLENVSLSYQKRIELADREAVPCNLSTHADTFVQNLNSQSMIVVRLLFFLKQIPEFFQLHADDKVTLVKHNLPLVLGMTAALAFNTETGEIKETISDVPVNMQHYRILYGYKTCMRSGKIFRSFLKMRQYDRKILELTLIILILTKSFSSIDHRDNYRFNDETSVNRAQNCYIELLWKYISTMCEYGKAASLFSQLIGDVLSWQSVNEEMQHDVLRTLSPDDINELVPICKSFLRIF